MKVGVYGSGANVEVWKQTISSVSGFQYVDVSGLESLVDERKRVDILFLANTGTVHDEIAKAAAKQAIHLFLDWPPAVSIRDCEAIHKVAEEAGVEAGVSRPLRFHPVFNVLPADSRPDLIVLRSETKGEHGFPGSRLLADVVDLCCALVHSYSVRHIEAVAVRNNPPWSTATAFSLRFYNGAYAQVLIRRELPHTRESLYISGTGFQVEADLDGQITDFWHRQEQEKNTTSKAAFVPVSNSCFSLQELEIRAFLLAIREKKTVPVTILDGQNTMRLVERIMERLR